MTTGGPDPSTEPLRDPRFDAAWRAASRDEPPAALDAAILAAARRAVGAGPQPVAVPEATRPERWWWPLAAAASIGAVAIGILQITASDRAGEPDPGRAVVSDMPAERSAAALPAAPATPAFVPAPAAPSVAPAPVVKAESAAADNAATAEARPRQRQMRAPAADAGVASGVAAKATAPVAASEPFAAPLPMPVGPAAPPPMQATPASPGNTGAGTTARDAQPFPVGAAAPQRRESDSARPAALGKVATAPAAGARADERTRERAPLPVAEWLALISKLRTEGRTGELDREVAAFRAAHPEAQQQLADALAGVASPPPAPQR